VPRRRSTLSLLPAAILCVALLTLVACTPPKPPVGPPTGQCRPDPFSADVQAFLHAAGAAAHHVTAAAYDDRTGCWYHLWPGVRVSTASVVKLEIAAAIHLRAQDRNLSVSRWEQDRISPMIRASDDSAATSLWGALGGVRGMSDWGARMGLTDTVETEPKWGLTSTTAEDQARFVHRLMQGDLLEPIRKGLLWLELRNVRPDQSWGIRSGVPAEWDVGHKNGFAPSACCGWRVNSVGYVADPAGGGYSIAILSDGWGSLAEGVPMVEGVARTVAGSLTR